ncbi:hypothetical protein DFH28DRAFT_1132049 [Melampsora americana]|nr:hypothetical protein DFH28DRAFT_1132049 [Melampsora americana]
MDPYTRFGNLVLLSSWSRCVLTRSLLNRVEGNRLEGSRPLGISPPYVPPSYAKNARIYQRRVLGNITNRPPQPLPPVRFSQERSKDVEWVDDSVNHAHHPTGNFNDRHEDYPQTYNFTQESPLKYSGVDSGNLAQQNTGTSVNTRTVEVNENDDPLPGPYEICQQPRKQISGLLLNVYLPHQEACQPN